MVVDAADVVVHPRNPRRGNVEVLAESLRVNGQFRPLLVQRSTGYILCGNHTFRAGVERLGWTSFRVLYVDCDDQSATKIMLADNRSYDLGFGWDERLLTDVLGELDDLAGSLWSLDDADDVMARLDALPVLEPMGAPSNPFAETPEQMAARRDHYRESEPRSALGNHLGYYELPHSAYEELQQLVREWMSLDPACSRSGEVFLAALRYGLPRFRTDVTGG